MNHFYRYLRYMTYAVEIFVVFIIQSTPNLIPEIYSSKPILLIPLVLSIAFFEGDAVGITVGVSAGILIDISAGGHIGFFSIFLLLGCYIVGKLTENLLKIRFFTAFVLNAIIISAICTLNWLFTYVFAGYGHITYSFMNHILPSIIYTLAVMPVFYFINRVFSRQLQDVK